MANFVIITSDNRLESGKSLTNDKLVHFKVENSVDLIPLQTYLKDENRAVLSITSPLRSVNWKNLKEILRKYMSEEDSLEFFKGLLNFQEMRNL